jgi:broad specificity phosphatase PhoE
MASLWFMRHGRASARELDYDRLHPIGEVQSRLLGERLRAEGQRFEHVFVGPHQRQKETWRIAREAAADIGASWPEPVWIEELAEAPYEVLFKVYLMPRLAEDAELRGLLDAVRDAAPEAREGSLVKVWSHMVLLWRNQELRGEDLEPAAVFEARVDRALGRIFERVKPGERAAIMTSNGVIEHALRRAGQEPPDGEAVYRLFNTSLTWFELTPSGLLLRDRDEAAHLVEAEHRTWL